MVDILLSRGIKVRGTTRSVAKGKSMLEARPESAGNLEFVQINDFEKGSADFADAVKGVDGVVHIASVSKFSLGGMIPFNN